jgi:hypothetical protein
MRGEFRLAGEKKKQVHQRNPRRPDLKAVTALAALCLSLNLPAALAEEAKKETAEAAK